MEESHYMNCKRDVLYSEKSKRRMKTPAQLQALEDFYNEHKYPSESMKLRFAEQRGLSEKQVSGWFCHRRLKDKRLLQGEFCDKGKQNLSNGAIHDGCSGFKQESCSSTKQGDRYESKEVESKRYEGQNSSVAFAASEQRGRASHVKCYTVADERSLGSSTASHERFSQRGSNLHPTSPRYAFRDDNSMLDRDGVNTRGYKRDLRSLCSNTEVDSQAISLVKLKLGMHYYEDGPTLAVDFDPPPPGAFCSLVRDSNCEPYYVGDTFRLRSCSTPVITKEPKMCDGNRSEMIASGSFVKVTSHNRKLSGFGRQNDYSGYQLTPMSSGMKNNNHIQYQTPMMDEGEDTAGEVSDEYKRTKGRYLMYSMEGESDIIAHHLFYLDDVKANATKSLPCLDSDYNNSATMFQRESFGANFVQPAARSKGLLITKDMQPRRPLMILKKKIDKEKKTPKLRNAVRPEVLTSSDDKLARKMHGLGFQRQDFVMTCPKKFHRQNRY